MDLLASFIEEEEVIQHCEPNIAFIVDEKLFGKGTLYVAESKLYWKNDNQVISVDYKSMCVFGTCNHPTVHEKPCMQIIVDFTYKPSDSMVYSNGHDQNGDNPIGNEDDNNIVENDDDDDDDEGEMKSKIKLVPDNSECLTEMYAAFTRVQPLHNSVDMDSDEDYDFHYNENDEFEDYDEDDDDEILLN